MQTGAGWPSFRPVIGNAFLVGGLLGSWSLASTVLGHDRLPTLWEVLTLAVHSWRSDPIISAQGGGDGFASHVLRTAVLSSSSAACGGALAIVVGTLVVASRVSRFIVESVIEVARVVPPLIAIPLALTVLPPTAPIVFTATTLYAFASMIVYVFGALERVRSDHISLARVLGASPLYAAVSVNLAAAVPELIAGLRITAVIAVGVCVVAEYLSAPVGIGRVMKFATGFARVDLIMVGAMWATLIALLIDFATGMLVRPFVKWASRSSLKGRPQM